MRAKIHTTGTASAWARSTSAIRRLSRSSRAATTAAGPEVKVDYAAVVDAAGARVAARLQDGTPLVLDKQIGEGHILLLASGLDNLTNDLPLHPVFVAFVDRAARYLSGTRAAERIAPGGFLRAVARRHGTRCRGRQRGGHRSGGTAAAFAERSAQRRNRCGWSMQAFIRFISPTGAMR